MCTHGEGLNGLGGVTGKVVYYSSSVILLALTRNAPGIGSSLTAEICINDSALDILGCGAANRRR